MAFECWRPVRGYVGLYLVSDIGRVKNQRTGRILKPDKSGKYLRVTLSKNGEKNRESVHRLVYESFCGEIPEGMEVDHIDGNKLNNKVENLRCVTHKENVNNPITKEKQIKGCINNAQDPEWKRKNTDAIKKRSQNKEWLKNTTEANKKKAKNPEWLRKNAEAAMKRAKDPDWLRKNSEAAKKALGKQVEQYTLDGKFVRAWESVCEAAKTLGYSQGNISSCCRGERKSAYGYIWKYADT